MKKMLLILSLAGCLTSTSLIATPVAPNSKIKSAIAWLNENNAHVVFYTLEEAQTFAKANNIKLEKIQAYVISSPYSTKDNNKKIYLIDKVGIGKIKQKR